MAILAYKACEEPIETFREKKVLPVDTKTEEPGNRPAPARAS